tara:strand:- start:228 stop:578 length:351 start_codon:yes stop_codon:yes gene_type:complete
MIRIITLALCLSFASISFVMASNERHAIAGPGAGTCGNWMMDRKKADFRMNAFLATWVQGFLSGMNTMRAMESEREMSMIPDSDTLLAYVDKQCEDDPLMSVYDISITLYGRLQQF